MPRGLVLVFHKAENGLLFEEIIISIKRKYTLVSVDTLAEMLLKKKDLKNICHISFDDGEKSFYDIIFPLLKKHGVPVSLFVSPDVISSGNNYWFQETTGFKEDVLKSILAQQLNVAPALIRTYSCGAILKSLPLQKIREVIAQYKAVEQCDKKPAQNMNPDQLRELDASGLVTIGAHTLGHPVLKNESDVDSQYEIIESLKKLQNLLGHPVNYFAYPNGRVGIDFDRREMRILEENNITLAFSTELDHLSEATDPLCVPRMSFARMGLSPSNPLVDFRMNLGKKWIDIKSIGKASEKEIRSRIRKLINDSLLF